MHGKVTDENARGGEGIDEAALGFVQCGVSDPDRLRSVAGRGDLNSVRGKVPGNARVGEGVRTQVCELEGTVEDINAAVGATIGSEKEVLTVVAAESEASVDGADSRAVSPDGGMADSGTRGGDDGTPAADGAVQRGKDEGGFAGLAILGDHKVAHGSVPDDAGGRALTATDKRNCDCEPDLPSRAGIESGLAGGVVADPEGAGWKRGKTPGVHQGRIRQGAAHAVVGDQVGTLILCEGASSEQQRESRHGRKHS